VLPPILEIYVIWHPGDAEGQQVFDWIFEHFHGTSFSGLIGGAVEVYLRTSPWKHSDAPRPIPVVEPLPAGLQPARVTIAVPVVGLHLCRAFADPSSDWKSYCAALAGIPRSTNFGVLPVRLESATNTPANPIAEIQALARESAKDPAVLCRDLSQQIVQITNNDASFRLRVFVSHTKHPISGPKNPVKGVVAAVRLAISDTHLLAYFDQQDVQPSELWAKELAEKASTSAMLAVRTDLYAEREWCQKEFLLAKQHEMPIVTLYAVERCEQRGSFIMDHVPVVGYRDGDADSIHEALDLLVAGALRRAIWMLCLDDLRNLGFDWMPIHAPEPVTIVPWLLSNKTEATRDSHIRIIHPDPPLGLDEDKVIRQILELAGIESNVEIFTPRTYASRGGGTE
jgi:hypothetical protein